MSISPQTVPIKIIMVGSINVGKTSLVTKYATGKKPMRKDSTKTATYVNKIKTVNGIKFEIKLWDTAGQEKYKSLTKLFIKDAKIAILVYSIDDEESFNDLDDWLKLIKSVNDDTVIYGVAGNKSDLSSDQIISDEKGQEYAKSIGAEWRSTSAVTEGQGIDNFINDLFLKYYNTYFNLNSSGSLSITLSNEPSQVKKGCCGGGEEGEGKNKTDNDNNNKKHQTDNDNNHKKHHHQHQHKDHQSEQKNN
jgi:small GTP-binding protein